MHSDIAEPYSADPVARESTRPAFVGFLNAQSSLEPPQLTAWFKYAHYRAHAFGFLKNGKYTSNPADALACMADCLAEREKILPWIQEYSPTAWAITLVPS